jgi:hypothetical protein
MTRFRNGEGNRSEPYFSAASLIEEAAEKHGSNYFPLSASEGGSFQGLGYFDNLP